MHVREWCMWLIQPKKSKLQVKKCLAKCEQVTCECECMLSKIKNQKTTTKTECEV